MSEVAAPRWIASQFGSGSKLNFSFIFKEYLKVQQENCHSYNRRQPYYASEERRLWTANTFLRTHILGQTILRMKLLTFPHSLMFNSLVRTCVTKAYPVLNGELKPIHQHVFESNLRNSMIQNKRYLELKKQALKGGGEKAILRHTQRNEKLLVRERLRLLLDKEEILELSPFAGLGMPYGDIPAAGCLTGIGKVSGVWSVFIANDATVKGGTVYPVTVKKQLRAQDIAMQNRLPCIYLVDSGGAFLPLQAEIFPDKNHGGRAFYNEAIMSAAGIPQVAVVCGSCTAGGAYIPTMADETVMVDKIGTIFLAGPPLVKAATGEDTNPEELGGATLHAKVSGCIDHFAATEEEAYKCARNVIATLNLELPPKMQTDFEEPLYAAEELNGLAPRDYTHTLNIKLILSRLTDGSKFLEFKALYGTTLVTGFAQIKGIIHNEGFVPLPAITILTASCCPTSTLLLLATLSPPPSQDRSVTASAASAGSRSPTSLLVPCLPAIVFLPSLLDESVTVSATFVVAGLRSFVPPPLPVSAGHHALYLGGSCLLFWGGLFPPSLDALASSVSSALGLRSPAHTPPWRPYHPLGFGHDSSCHESPSPSWAPVS
ncbi:probable methylcrotonoyl-CoA carboxylase beta chain, mitochondrial isoform X3 [Narcine bancroftii]|uniref:probable methylcrotonoyl-CoA carboxylase beta chain, mitochondrial isoform X3 n=1 Tax=Narcine bancroftii TaxID=1343680 RepID=UPI0038316053